MMRRLFGKLCIANRHAGRSRWQGGTATPPDLSGFDCSHHAAPELRARRCSRLTRFNTTAMWRLYCSRTFRLGDFISPRHSGRRARPPTGRPETSAARRVAPQHRPPCLLSASGQVRAKPHRPCSSSCIRSAPVRRRDGRKAPATPPGKSPSASGRSSPASIFPRTPGR